MYISCFFLQTLVSFIIFIFFSRFYIDFCAEVSFFFSMTRPRRFRKRHKIIARKVNKGKKSASKEIRAIVCGNRLFRGSINNRL